MSEGCEHPKDKLEFTYGAFAWGLLTDWRMWVVLVLAGVTSGLLSSVFGSFRSVASGVPGLAVGLYSALMLPRIRKCHACGQIVRFPLRGPGLD